MRGYIARAVGQIYTCPLDCNESCGYLVIYNTSNTDLRFALSDQIQSTPFVVHNNKTIFLLTVDVFPHEEPASKRPRIKTVEVTESDLIEIIEEGGD